MQEGERKHRRGKSDGDGRGATADGSNFRHVESR